MSGTATADLTVEVAERPDRLPADALALMAEADDLFAGRTWWDLVLAHALPADTHATFVTVRSGARTLLLAPMLRSTAPPHLSGLTTPYTCRYAPLLARGLDEPARIAAMRGFARFCGRAGLARLDALPADWDGLPALQQGARQAGLRLLRFDHFGNWHENVAGLGWHGYLAARPGALRETIRRRLRKAEALAGARFTLLALPDEMDRATAAFETVYALSWKEPEPFPRFNAAFMRAMAADGTLRFGLWSLGDIPVAVQIWVVHNGCATVLKLAHDEAFKPYSPGTVLTALMLRHLLDNEAVTQVDFGRGDDDYKKAWAVERRQRIGVLLANPRYPSGLLAIARHRAGQLRAQLRGSQAG